MHSINSNLLTLILLSQLLYFHVLLVPVSAKVFISIDCGSSSLEPYTDTRSIVWVGDNQYVRTGEARSVIANDIPDDWDSRVMSTLREFPTRSTNCYSIDVDDGKSEDSNKVERVLVRASFYYGNYDNKSVPPLFYLLFNGNEWDYVQTSMTGIVHKEVVYSLNQYGNTITVCLFRLGRGTPFISALEVRSLDSDIYSYVDSNYPLIFMQREAYGTNSIVRYPEDSCDRIWDPIGQLGNTSGLIKVRNTSPSIKIDINDDKVPEALFTTATMLKNISETLWIISDNNNYEYPRLPRHFNLYFSEVIELNSTQKRSFNITVYTYDDKDRFITFRDYGPVIPPYGQALQFRITNVTASKRYKIAVYATDDSNLPPLVNAFEVYTIGDELVQATNSKDGTILFFFS
ncbi:hypothetical protein MKW94_015865 [Papaver nudicaule]|uniref:Malectin-like domain-containing protein n=1 Tax=Papaver nudicaule TaxID=74823 RepID=A0AA41S6J0_PAPNU|nr:hypothetical protein [Papaver nudicaule]